MGQPVVLSARTLLVVMAAAVVLSVGLAFAAVTLSLPQTADAQVATAASEVGELKKTNRTLSSILNSIGKYDYSGSSLRKNTKDIEQRTYDVEQQVHKLCLAVAQYSYEC